MKFSTGAFRWGLHLMASGTVVIFTPTLSSASEIEEVLVTTRQQETRVENLTFTLQQQGVNFFTSGGVAKIPVVNGLNDDRVKVLVNGAESPSACGNHMNPALSYADVSHMGPIEVIAGITPVSMGGDSIAGTIVVDSPAPIYADQGESLTVTGELKLDYHSNNSNARQSLHTSIASQAWSLGYRGSNDKAESGEDGYGDPILDTLYRVENHALTLGHKREKQRWTLRYSHQYIPYQGFPNQYMDMVSNISDSLNLNQITDFSWGELDTRLTWQDIRHEMGFFTEEKTGTMPMVTDATNYSFSTKATIATGKESFARTGVELHDFNLNDYWPAVPGHPMMGPNDFVNINDGQKQRLAVFVETDAQFTPKIRTRFGLRYEHVTTNAGEVQPYSDSPMVMMMPNMDRIAAAAFNSAPRKQRDDNLDLTTAMRYQRNEQVYWELGYARKTRSPNLYERYSWGRGDMAMSMIGWFGDGNGYVGDIELNPEIAHTLSLNIQRQNAQEHSWSLGIAPFYTYVDDYIDAEVIGEFHPRRSVQATRNKLQLTNEDATIYGVNLNLTTPLWNNPGLGQGALAWRVQYQRGERKYDSSPLYQMMPVNAGVALQHSKRNWQSFLEVQWADDKSRVDERRLENSTGSYSLINLGTRAEWTHVQLAFEIKNALDEHYHLPLGGVSIAQWIADGQTDTFLPVSGLGRSVDVSLTYRF